MTLVDGVGEAPRMAKVEPLGLLEAWVMDVAWRKGPVTAREVTDAQRGRRRAYTTIMTTMDRLHKKGLLAREKDGLAWRYTPKMTREELERSLADELASEILSSHGEIGLAAFVDATARDAALLERLAELIKERKPK